MTPYQLKLSSIKSATATLRISTCLKALSVCVLTGVLMLSSPAYCQLTHEVTDIAPKRIFFVHYRHTAFVTSEDVRAGFLEEVTKLGVKASIQADHIRFGLEGLAGDKNIAEAVLLKSIKDWKPQLIVVHGLKSANAFNTFNAEKFSQWPILFIATPRLPQGLRAKYPNSTAILDYFPLKENYELVQRLHPDADRIILIGTSAKVENFYRFKTANQLIAHHTGKAQLISMFDVPADQLYRDIGDSNTKDVIIDLKDYIDELGAKVYVDTFMSTMQAKKKPVPIYSFWKPTRDYKVTGGIFFDEKQKGKNAADTAVQILKTGRADNIPIKSLNNSVPMFFWSELQRHNIAKSDLPAGSRIFNEPILLSGAQWKILGAASAFAILQIIFIIYLLRSIRKRRIAEFDMAAARDEAQQANQIKSRFLANMSHEIRTPMNAILGFSEILLRKDLPPTYHDHMNAINTSGKTLMRLINDILDLSKIESGTIQLQAQAISIKNTLSETESIFRLAAEKKGLAFSVGWKSEFHDLLVLDDIRLRQILFNLAGNAIKFTSTGYVKINVAKIESTSNPKKVDLYISVSDSGIGIQQENIETIFDEFVQQDGQDSSVYGGTGLGLAISKRLTELMGGDISVESTLGEGTTFHVRLYDIDVVKAKAEINQPTRTTSVHSFNGERILVAEDNKLNQKLFYEIGNELNLTIEIAYNGKQAINIIKQDKPVIAIFDIEMPVLDGISAIEQLRASRNTRDLPILIVSATDRDDAADLVKKYNLLGFARKPLERRELSEYLTQAIDQNSRANESHSKENKTQSSNTKTPLTHEQLKSFRTLMTNQLSTAASCRDIDFIESHVQKVEILQKKYSVNAFDTYVKKYQTACSTFDISLLGKAAQDYEQALSTSTP